MGGSLSYSSKTGPVDYTVSVKNGSGPGRAWWAGQDQRCQPCADRARFESYHSEYEQISTQLKLGIDGPGSSVGNLTLGYTPYWNPQFQATRATSLPGEVRTRTNRQSLDGLFADVNGDYEFALGPGRLKLIGLAPLGARADRRHRHDRICTSSGADPLGTTFNRDTHLGETIGRAEYHWKGGRNDWQLSFERAFNSLDQRGDLFQLDPDRQFVPVPFPEATGRVEEVRYEGIATLSRPLAPTSTFSLRPAAKSRGSTAPTDDRPARKFFRPKGSVILAGTPQRLGHQPEAASPRRDRSASTISLPSRSSARTAKMRAIPDLVPPQSWEAETEFARDLGRWGKTRLNLHYYRRDRHRRRHPHRHRRARDRQPAPRAQGMGRRARARSTSIRSGGTAPSSISMRRPNGPRSRIL